SRIAAKPARTARGGDQDARAGDVQGDNKEENPGAERGEHRDRLRRPRLAGGEVGGKDQRQREQDVRGRQRRVEDDVAAQPGLEPCAGSGFEGGDAPSSGAGAMSIRGRMSSIGKGSSIVVFFSEPISTMVCRKRSWSAPFCEEMTSAAFASV